MIRRLMYGRYGNDHLNVFLFAAAMVLWFFDLFFRWRALSLVCDALLLLALYRTLSRNLGKRREENIKFMALCEPVVSWYRLRRTIRRDKEHCYFKCPSCGQQLRVPRGKGTITVTCRNCGASFQEKS